MGWRANPSENDLSAPILARTVKWAGDGARKTVLADLARKRAVQ